MKVTTEIDFNLKMMFEATRDQHGMSYKDILEKGIEEVLKQYDPVGALKASIERKEKDLQEDRERLAGMTVLQPAQKKIKDYNSNESAGQVMIEEWFTRDPVKIVKMYDKHAINYKRVAETIGTISARQAQEWIFEVVKKWKAKHDPGVIA